jgi:heat shock protein 4
MKLFSGLNVLKLMNETTSTALAYGIYKQDLPPPEEKARNVIFVDVGHIGIQAAACSFNKGKLVMKACTFDRGCGGYSFDIKLSNYFADEFKAKTKLDARSNMRVFLKLMTEAEKVKKQMSANTNMLPLNIECFMEERDLSCRADRTMFEEMIAPELQRIEAVLQECLALSEWKLEDIYSVEIVGGSTRVPAIKSAIERVFGKVPNTTLNADEAISRGCALQCAILSPTFKVREFSVTDIQPFEIKLNWEAESDKGDMVVFPKFHQIPFSKLLTFYRRDNFTVEATYGGSVPHQNPFIGRFEIGEVKPMPDGGNQKVKVKVRINLNGVFTVSSASLIEKQEIEEEVPMEVDEVKADGPEKAADAPPSTEGESPKSDAAEKKDAEMADASEETKKEAPKMEKRKKIVTKNVDLPVTPLIVGSLSRDKLEKSVKQEVDMNKMDQQEIERLHAKNAVEEYIYGIREKIGDELEEYLTEDDRTKYSHQLEETENWLYEEGEDVDRSHYVDKLKELKLVGEASKKRKTEFEGRKAAVEVLGHSLQMAFKIVEAFKAGDEQYNHLVPSDVDRVAKLITEKREWLDKSIAELEKTPKTKNPSILICQFYSERDAFEAVCKPILNKKKPKVEPPKEEDKKSSETAKPEEKKNPAPEETAKTAEPETAQVNGGSQMDLD